MKKIQKKIPLKNFQFYNEVFFDTNAMLFDIETTGFSPKTSFLYMIGCAYIDNEFLYIFQFLSQKTSEEEMLLKEFCNHCNKNSAYLTFNGLGFDVPYLQSKFKKYKLEDPFINSKQIDLYKELRYLKEYLKIENIKQKTFESFLGINRNDKFSGGELISTYLSYERTMDPDLEDLLLLHNFEDLTGLFQITSCLSYKSAFWGEFDFEDGKLIKDINYDQLPMNYIVLKGTLKNNIPMPISFQWKTFYISLEEQKISISVRVENEAVIVPYQNAKDYYYLPNEDIAVLKSLATSIPQKEKVPAVKENCYGKFQIKDSTIFSKEIFEPYMKRIMKFLYF